MNRIIVIIGLVTVTLGFFSPLIGLSTVSALPQAITGTQVLQMPPCNGQDVSSCVVNQTWTGTLLTPAQALVVWGYPPDASTCGLIALWQTDVSPTTVPLYGSASGARQVGGTVYVSIDGTSVGRSTNWATYQYVDGASCAPPTTKSTTTTTASNTISSTTTSATATTTSTSGSGGSPSNPSIPSVLTFSIIVGGFAITGVGFVVPERKAK